MILKGILIGLHVLVSLVLIAVVLLQSGRSAGLGAIAGGAEVLFGKKKGLDEFLGRVTTVVAVLFALTSLVLGFRYY